MQRPEEHLEARLARAKELLKTARHAAMATVNPDGSPHNTPFFMILDDGLTHVYFGSHPNSQHSQNVVRTGQMFVVLYGTDKGGGLYIKATNGHELSGSELGTGLAVHNARRAAEGKAPIPLDYYQTGPQRMYVADIDTMWVNMATRSDDGLIIREYRQEITPQDLLH